MTSDRKIRLGAAIFNADHGRLADEIKRIESAGLDFIHLDVFDGYFVPDLGFSPRTIATLRQLTTLPFEVHLGVKETERFIPKIAEAGADMVIPHIESISTTYEIIDEIRSHGLKAGLAFTIGIPLIGLEPIISFIDSILLLSRRLGESIIRGTSFSPLVMPRIRFARSLADSLKVKLDIQVAGGVKPLHVKDLVSAGATSIVLGRCLYETADMKGEVEKIRALLER
jgi:ribulose-phosphate 3-epimerase